MKILIVFNCLYLTVWWCMPGLSTLPDNPGDSRFWIISPGLQIRVWNLADNRRSLPFLVDATLAKWNFKYFAFFELFYCLYFHMRNFCNFCNLTLLLCCTWCLSFKASLLLFLMFFSFLLPKRLSVCQASRVQIWKQLFTLMMTSATCIVDKSIAN